MKRPIQSGDLCIVINGMGGENSPNLGLIVEVICLVYECPQLGQIWRCKADYAERLVKGEKCQCPPGHADFAQDWLKKIEPDEIPMKSMPVLADLAQ